MNTSEAVKLAQEGEEEGFSFLYQETCQKSYYVALKYMKREDETFDVLQDLIRSGFILKCGHIYAIGIFFIRDTEAVSNLLRG